MQRKRTCASSQSLMRFRGSRILSLAVLLLLLTTGCEKKIGHGGEEISPSAKEDQTEAHSEAAGNEEGQGAAEATELISPDGGQAPAAAVSPHGEWEIYPQNARVLTAVNARVSPDGESSIAAVLNENEEVRLMGSTGSYYEVEYQGTRCYVMRKYIFPDNYLSMGHAPFSPPASLSQIDPNKPMVALTFDDGPKAEVTNRILAALESHGSRATFYMMGGRVVGENNECVKKMLSMGCDIGNHTYNHDYFNVISLSEIRPAVRKADYMIEETCGQSPTSLRPPGGAVDEAVSEELRKLGLASILWSIDTLDWDTKDADNTYRVVMEKVRDGDIILMHDTYSQTADAAERLIPALIERGFQLVTVSELAASRGQVLEPGKVYSQFWK